MSDDSFTTYETTATYDTGTTYDTIGYTYDTTTSYDTGITYDTTSYSYDSTDWSQVGEVSQGYVDTYDAAEDLSWDLWHASNDAWLNGDSTLAYELNQASLDANAFADQAWDTSFDVWTEMAETTTVTTYEPSDATAYTSSYDTTSYDTSAYDTSSAYTTSYDTSAYDTSSYDTSTVDAGW